MSNNASFSWDDRNFVDSGDFDQGEANAFRNFMSGGSESSEEGTESSFAAGSLLKGTIVEVSKDYAVVDVGLKSEGLIPVTEFVDPSELYLGSEIEVMLEATEDAQGQIVLSREKARRQRQWEYILEHCSEGSIVRGTVTRKVKGGLMVDIGMEAFLPGSQVDNKRIKNLEEFLGKTFDLKILKINVERKNVVVSRREVIEAERLAKKTELLDTMEVGQVRRGVVKNITDFGVFLDLDGIDGLLHITDMTWKRIRHPSEMVELGQELDVIILSIDPEKGRIALGLKQQKPNPWEDIQTRYPQGTIVEGQIVNLVPYGAFIELEEGIEGLIHVSEMSWTRNVAAPEDLVRKGQKVRAVVLNVDPKEGKISLGMKQVEHNPWEGADERYAPGTKVQVKVCNMTNYGAFVALEPGIDGLILSRDLSWTRKFAHPSEVLELGQTLEAKVLTVDTASRKITLGIKQLQENPFEGLEERLPIGTKVRGRVKRIAAFGVFVELELEDIQEELEALVHVTDLSNTFFRKIEDVVSVGDEVTVRITGIDAEKQQISASLKSSDEGGDDILLGGGSDG